MRIGVTDTLNPKFEYYARWLRESGRDIKVVKLSSQDKNSTDLDTCDALVMSGGHDVNPSRYGRSDARNLVKDINDARDEFELALLDRAFAKDFPILGICRGLQITNVFLGGNLVPDLESAGYRGHDKKDAQDSAHMIEIQPESYLGKSMIISSGKVNSAHHQAANQIGKGLRISARSSDGVIEAMEREDHHHFPFLLLVQWHPERMTDVDHPYSKRVRETFLDAVEKSKEQFV